MKLFAVLLFVYMSAACFGQGDSLSSCPKGLLYSVPQCCYTDILGVADLDCKAPSSGSASGFTCQSGTPRCCAIPVAGLALLCTEALG